jgi:hypothetical protein
LKKIKKLWAIVALFFLGVQSLTPVTQVFAMEPTASVETVEVAENTNEEQATIDSTTDSTSKVETIVTEDRVQTKADNEEKIGESQNSNDSPSDSLNEASSQEIETFDQEDGKIYSSNRVAYTQLNGSESDSVKEELVAFMDAHVNEIQAIRGASYNAHVGYTASNGILYEFTPSESPAQLRRALQARSGITISVVQQFNVNWHIRMPNSGLETWGEIFDELATPEGKPLFCIEPGILVNGVGGYSETVLPGQITKRMQQGATIGYTENRDTAHYWNTQTFLWDELGVQWIQNSGRNQAILNEIYTGIDNLAKRPSFNNQQVTLKVGESVTLTDTNGIFKDYQKMSSNTSGVKVERNGNQIKLTAEASSNEAGSVNFRKYSVEPVSVAYVKPGSQSVAFLMDPDNALVKINVKVIKNGNAEFVKLSDVSDLPLADVTYKVKVGNEAKKEMKTNAEGKLIFKDLLDGTVIQVTEISNPEGYVLDNTTYNVTIEGGKTVSKTLTNKIQKGRFKGQKQKEVFNAEKTWEKGTPIYDMVPAAGVKFDVVAKKDIMLPDHKTVVVKAGTVVDQVVTDDKGNFSSTTDLYIGEENIYQLKETNKPDNYLDPTDVQTEFSIPYGKNTETLIYYDLGMIENRLKKAKVTFNKKNALDLASIFNISGAEFLVEGLSPDVKDVQFKFTTEKTGTVMNLLAGNGTATYKVTEVKAPSGFGQPFGSTETRIITVTEGKDQTVDWENMPLVPKIHTKAHGENGEKTFDPTKDNVLIDDIYYEDVEVGKEKTLVTKIVEVGTGKVIKEIEGQVVFDKQEGTYVVKTVIPANTIKENTKTVFQEFLYNDKEKTEEYAKHDDLNDQDQTVDWQKPVTPTQTITPTKAVKVATPTTSTLPKSGAEINLWITFVGLFMVVIISVCNLYMRYKKEA